MEYKIEWHDPVYGDFFDYDRMYSDDPITTEYGDVYYQVNTNYQITIYMTDIYVPGMGYFDQIVRLTKTSDSTAPIPLKRSVEMIPDSPMLPINPELVVLAF